VFSDFCITLLEQLRRASAEVFAGPGLELPLRQRRKYRLLA